MIFLSVCSELSYLVEARSLPSLPQIEINFWFLILELIKISVSMIKLFTASLGYAIVDFM